MTQQRKFGLFKINAVTILTVIWVIVSTIYSQEMHQWISELYSMMIPQRVIVACHHLITIHGKHVILDLKPVEPQHLLRDERQDTEILDIIWEKRDADAYARRDIIVVSDESGLIGCGLLEFEAKTGTITSFRQRWEHKNRILDIIASHWGNLTPDRLCTKATAIALINQDGSIIPFEPTGTCGIAGFLIDLRKGQYILAGRFIWHNTWAGIPVSLLAGSPIPAQSGSVFAIPENLGTSETLVRRGISNSVIGWNIPQPKVEITLNTGVIPAGRVMIYSPICTEQKEPVIITYSGYIVSDNNHHIRPIYREFTIRGANR